MQKMGKEKIVWKEDWRRQLADPSFVEKILEYRRCHFPDGVPHGVARQHYVPCKYLESWASGRKVAMRVRGSRAKMVGTMDVGVSQWFYEFDDLRLEELESLLKLIDMQNEYECQIMSRLLSCSVIIQIARNWDDERKSGEARLMLHAIKQHNLYNGESDMCLSITRMALRADPMVAQKGYELLRKQGLELVISGIENASWPYLNMLCNGDARCLENPKLAIHVVEYIFLQMYRTPKLDAFVSEAETETDTALVVAKSMIPYLRVLLAVKAVYRTMVHLGDISLRLWRVEKEDRLVTGDYPFAHLPVGADSFVFPISPRSALLFGCKNLARHEITASDVNCLVAKDSVNQIYAKSCDDIDDLEFPRMV